MSSSHSPLLLPVFTEEYPVFRSGSGCWIVDEDGKQYLDGSSGAIVCNIGHADNAIADVMYEQCKRLEYVSRLQGVSRPAMELAERIASDWAPSPRSAVWFSSSGSDAVESAIRLARQFHVERGDAGRYKVVSTWQSYHGSTLGALAASGREGPRNLFQPYFANAWPHIEGAYCYRCPYGQEPRTCGTACADELESIIVKEGPETIAAFIVEPVVGTTTGGTHPPESYFRRVEELCERYGVLFVVDEVMSGFGRTGAKFGADHWRCKPDIIAAGKGLGSGYAPLFVTIVNERVRDAIMAGSGRIALGNTYNGNPLSCAVGIGVLDEIERRGLVEAAAARGKQLRSRLEGLYASWIVGDVRGLGLMQGVEFVADRGTRRAFDPSVGVSRRVARAAAQRGVLVTQRPGTVDGRRGDHVFLTPPLTVNDEEIEKIGDVMDEAVRDVATELAGQQL